MTQEEFKSIISEVTAKAFDEGYKLGYSIAELKYKSDIAKIAKAVDNGMSVVGVVERLDRIFDNKGKEIDDQQ